MNVVFAEYDQFDGLGLADLVRRRHITAGELVEEAIQRIERMEAKPNPLGAVMTRAFDRARTQARTMPTTPANAPPFAGVPFLLKDLGPPWAGVRLCSGSRYFLDHVPDHDGLLVQRFHQAGLISLGRTTVPELGLLPFTEPRDFPAVATPWAEGLTAGGSSGGAAAAVAAGLVPMAHGGDGGGSLRIPASCCGLFGFKPSRGRSPFGPDLSEAWFGMVVEHAITRSVRDSAALLDAIAAPAPGALYHAPAPPGPFLARVSSPPGRLRVAFTTQPFFPGTVHPDCVAAAQDAATLVQSLGHDVEDVTIDLDRDGFLRDFFTLVCVEVAMQIRLAAAVRGTTPRRRDFEVATWMMAIRGAQIAGPALALARHRLQGLARQMGTMFESYDVLITPTLAQPPLPFGALLPRGFDNVMQKIIVNAHLDFLLRVPGVPARLQANAATVLGFTPFAPLANVTGQPSMSVPLFWNQAGLPLGSMFTARYGDDATLFQLAGQLEQARPWSGRRPPKHAANLPVETSPSARQG